MLLGDLATLVAERSSGKPDPLFYLASSRAVAWYHEKLLGNVDLLLVYGGGIRIFSGATLPACS